MRFVNFVRDCFNASQLIDLSHFTFSPTPPLCAPRVSRVCERECEVAGYTVPAGVFIDIPIYYLHHNPEWWTEPEKFDPERCVCVRA